MERSPELRLTKNEKNTLRELISEARVSDTDIAKKLGISQQAVYQIRKRLEDLGVIKGYVPIVDFKELGLSVLFFTGIEVQPALWEEMTEDQLNERFRSLPFLFQLFRIPSSDISYIAIFGFRSIAEQESFATKLERRLSKDMRLRWSYTASVNNILSYGDLNMVFHALADAEVDMVRIFKDFSG